MANSSSGQPPQLSASYLAEDISGQLLAATTVILVITTALVALRFYARSLTNASAGWDDLLLPPSWILVVGACTTGYLAVAHSGVGHHLQWVIAKDPDMLITRGKILYTLGLLTALANAASRCSVLSLFLRVITSRVTRIATWVAIIYLILLAVAQSIVGLVECKPIAYFWDPSIAGGTCIDQFLFYKLNGFLNIIADLVIIILPTHTVWTLQTSVARRAGIAMAFASGGLRVHFCLNKYILIVASGLVASCARTASFFTSAQEVLEDPPWIDVGLMSWTIVESGMYLCAACLIGLRPLVDKAPAWLKRCTTVRGAGSPAKSSRAYRGTGRSDSVSRMIPARKQGQIQLSSFDQGGYFPGRDPHAGSES